MVTTFRPVSTISARAAYRVDVLPLPVGPVIRRIPSAADQVANRIQSRWSEPPLRERILPDALDRPVH
jgi:hypothetical protein